MTTINQSAPTEIAWQVMRSDAVEASYPSLESAIVGVNVLYVIGLGDHPNACRQIDRAVDDAHFPSGSTQGLRAVGAENCIACQEGLERGADVCALSAFSRTKSVVLPVRSRQIRTGICSSDKPRFYALPPRLRGVRAIPCFLPLNDSRKNVSSASAIPTRFVAFC